MWKLENSLFFQFSTNWDIVFFENWNTHDFSNFQKNGSLYVDIFWKLENSWFFQFSKNLVIFNFPKFLIAVSYGAVLPLSIILLWEWFSDDLGWFRDALDVLKGLEMPRKRNENVSKRSETLPNAPKRSETSPNATTNTY